MKDFLVALLPSAGVLAIFYVAIKAIVEADRRERAAVARLTGQSPSATPGSARDDAGADPRADAVPGAGTDTLETLADDSCDDSVQPKN